MLAMGSLDISKVVATNVRIRRSAAKVTQSVMAGRASMPRPTWTKLESGGGNPTIKVVAKAAGALNVSVAQLVTPHVFPSCDTRPLTTPGAEYD